MAGRWSPRTTRCRRNGSTPCWSPNRATKCSPWARHRTRVRTEPFMPVSIPEDLDDLHATVSDPSWDYLHALQQALPTGNAALQPGPGIAAHQTAAFKSALSDGDDRLRQRFLEEEPVERLVRDRARLVDLLLKAAWKLQVGEHTRDVALIAVGGYGRGELS